MLEAVKIVGYLESEAKAKRAKNRRRSGQRKRLSHRVHVDVDEVEIAPSHLL